MSAEAFARSLRTAEDRLRAVGLTGREAYAALCRHLAQRLDLPEGLWLPGVDAPSEAGLDALSLTGELDFFGLAYERFFPEVFKAERGQFFTPQPLVELLVELAGVRPGVRVLDPTCGSGSLLVAAWARGAEVDGIEVDREVVALCRLNLKLHGANPRAVRNADFFREPLEEERWDVVLANPPYSLELADPELLEGFELGRGKARESSDVLFVEAAARRLRPGGRLAAVLPHSVLANPGHASLRAWLAERFVRQAVISLPEGVFRPFGGTASRACLLVLQKRPARLRGWQAAVIRHPGYDVSRRTFRRTEPDELGLVRLAAREGRLPRLPAGEPEWSPEALLGDSAMVPGVPLLSLHELAPPSPWTVRPADEPADAWTEIDLGDVDKQTGEVTAARTRRGGDFRGPKTAFVEGDLLLSRLRPRLNTVGVASRPSEDLPERLCGSSEWVRLCPPEHPLFALLALRSSFLRAQLQATGGQTRPRLRTEDLHRVHLPAPSLELRARMDALAREAHEVRRAARRRLDALAELYEAFGRGELDEAALGEALKALEREAGPD